MLIQATRRFVERDLRQRSAVDRAQEVLTVLEMSRAVRRAGRKAGIEIERMMMRLKIRAAFVAIVDDLALLLGRAAPVRKRRVPASRVPGPGDVPGRERVADRLQGLRRHRLAPELSALRIGEVRIAVR